MPAAAAIAADHALSAIGYAADGPAQAGISAFSCSDYSPVMTPVAPPVTARMAGQPRNRLTASHL